MARYLIDANLPHRSYLWYGVGYVPVFDLNDRWVRSARATHRREGV